MLQQRREIVAWDAYATSGLVARYQGLYNTAAGHSSSTLIWEDLIGDADLFISSPLLPGTRQWGPNYFESLKVNQTHFAWLSSPLPAIFSPEHSTMEVVFMPYTGADSSNGGDIIGIDAVPTAPFTTVALEMSAMNASYLVEETSTFVTVNRRTLTANTIYTASMPVSPFSSIPAQNGTKAIFYNGAVNYRAARIAPLFVQLPQHTVNLSGNPAILDVRQVFYGRIYEVRIYNRALTDAEIANNARLDRQIYGF